MENMWAIAVYHDPGFSIAIGMAIASRVRTLVNDNRGDAGFSKLPGNYCTRETSAYYANLFIRHEKICLTYYIKKVTELIAYSGLSKQSHFFVLWQASSIMGRSDPSAKVGV